MATIPDTPAIANALNRSDPVQEAARARLLILHQLGGTSEQVEAGLRQQIDTLAAELEARPTLEELAEVETERDRLQARIDELTAVPTGPFSVPVVQFRAGLIPMRKALLNATTELQLKWSVILPELDVLTAVYPREQPVAGLLDEAVADGLLTSAQALALRGGA